uniref:Hedgehog acyltransferase n=1 Tax=Pavo cristatus TaxID=9049 RepID=A0A8C9FDV6_PAVCR
MLPAWEMCAYLFLTIGSHFYSFYEVYQVSQKYEDEIDRSFGLEQGTLFWGLKKDALDFEWSYWIEWGREHILWLLAGHLLVSQMCRLFMDEYKPWCLMVYGMVACWFLLGIKGFAVILLHTAVSFAVAQFQIPLLTWLCSLILLSTLHIPAVEEAKSAAYFIFCSLLLISTLIYRLFLGCSVFLCYLFCPTGIVFPYFFSFLPFAVFFFPSVLPSSLKQSVVCHITFLAFSLKTNLGILIMGIIRIFFWWCLAELMIHFMYIHAICSTSSSLEAMSYWALGGVALAQVLFFYVKYLVLYGIAALLLRMDGLRPPALPRCVSLMHSFTKMWRLQLDVLSEFGMYIYVPMGGSQSSLPGMLFSTALTFAFVSYWHGGQSYLWYWGVLNWLGVIVENGVKRILSASLIQDLIVS